MSDENFKKAIEAMGQEPINPIGSCFDSTAHQLFTWMDAVEIKICHGIGVASMPGQEGAIIGHAWLERDGLAFDCIWGVKTTIAHYRASLNLTYCVEYTPMEFFMLALEHDYPGPWDKKILAITEKVKL